jgi:hypothetical protein
MGTGSPSTRPPQPDRLGLLQKGALLEASDLDPPGAGQVQTSKTGDPLVIGSAYRHHP